MEQPPPPAGRPVAIRVFGILHLISSGIGIIGYLGTLHTAIFSHRFEDPEEPRLPQSAAPDGAWWHVFGSFITINLLVDVLMLVAGLKLERNRRDAIRASNRYAIASLWVKASMIALAFLSSSPTDFRPNLIGMIYPLLCLILLNRRPAKDWLATYGT